MLIPTIPYSVQAYGLTDVGLLRENNEDAWKVAIEENVFILADGMGGHLAGEVAANSSVQRYEELIKQRYNSSLDLEQTTLLLKEVICEVNRSIHRMSRSDSDLRGMGTTLCTALFHPEGMVYGHVGDSRIYLMRRQKLRQLTEDHSLVQELIELGELSEKRARDYSHRNIITKAIGTEPSIEPSIKYTDVKSGDLILMCSDGLTDLLTHDEIEQTLFSVTKLEKKAELLVKEANRRGGFDNITVVLMKIQAKHEKLHLPG